MNINFNCKCWLPTDNDTHKHLHTHIVIQTKRIQWILLSKKFNFLQAMLVWECWFGYGPVVEINIFSVLELYCAHHHCPKVDTTGLFFFYLILADTISALTVCLKPRAKLLLFWFVCVCVRLNCGYFWNEFHCGRCLFCRSPKKCPKT